MTTLPRATVHDQPTKRTAAPVASSARGATGRPSRRRRSALRSALNAAATALNRGLHRLPVCHWLHRRAQRAMEFSRVDVPLRRGRRGLDGLSIAYLVDIHAGSFVGEDDLTRVFERVTELGPDLVCLGGDLINSRPDELLALRRPLRSLTAPLGVFAVPGNHDRERGHDVATWASILEEHGVEVLLDRGVRLARRGASLWLAGVDDLTEGTPDLDRALAGRRAGEPAVLLAHQPDHFLEAVAADIDLTLSGHTHGGQIRLGGWTPVVHSAHGFRAGMYESGPSRLYVSRGVGATVLPLRIGARAEVPLLRLGVPAEERPAWAGPSPLRRDGSQDA